MNKKELDIIKPFTVKYHTGAVVATSKSSVVATFYYRDVPIGVVKKRTVTVDSPVRFDSKGGMGFVGERNRVRQETEYSSFIIGAHEALTRRVDTWDSLAYAVRGFLLKFRVGGKLQFSAVWDDSNDGYVLGAHAAKK